MFGLLESLRSRFRNRPDGEHEQALVRVSMAALALMYLAGLAARGQGGNLDYAPESVAIILAETLLGLALLAAIALRPAASHLRRALGMTGDYASLAALMSIQAEALAPLYVIVLWVTIDNGLRYGPRYLIAAMVLALGSFLFPLLSSAYWHANLNLGWGLWMGLLAIPGALLSLSRSAASNLSQADTSHESLTGTILMPAHPGTTRQDLQQRECAEVIPASYVTRVSLAGNEIDIGAAGAKIIAFDDPFVRHRARVRPLHLLVADDQPANRLMLQCLLQRAGHEVSFAEHGESALDQIEVCGFDAAIVELRLPKMSGLDVLKHARMMQAGRSRTPIIIVSADAAADTMREVAAFGGHAFLTKPVVVSRLLETLAAIAVGAEDQAATPRREGAVFKPPVVSLVVLQELAAMNLGAEFLPSFVEQCMRDASYCLAELERAGAASQWEQMREAAYALKGLCENLGAQSVVEGCSEIMRCSEAGLRLEWRSRVSRLESQLHSSAQVVRAELKRLSGVGAEDWPGKDSG